MVDWMTVNGLPDDSGDHESETPSSAANKVGVTSSSHKERCGKQKKGKFKTLKCFRPKGHKGPCNFIS